MTRKKLDRFAELRDFPNCLQREEILLKRNWVRDHFRNDKPLVLELGCGRGVYTLALARHCKGQNVIGVDKKGARIWKGARRALDEGIQNAAFLRIKVEDLMDCLGPKSVDQIWIPFPDPLPKRRQAQHRLISLPFLEFYRSILKEGGRIHLKTDDEGLVTYLLQLLDGYPVEIHRDLRDLHNADSLDPMLMIKTTYELRHLKAGRTIKYVCFSFRGI